MKIKGCPLHILQVSVEDYVFPGAFKSLRLCEPQSNQLVTVSY